MNGLFASPRCSALARERLVAALVVWLALVGLNRAQLALSTTDFAPPVALAPLAPPWPAVDWGLPMPKGGNDHPGRLLDGEPMVGLSAEPPPAIPRPAFTMGRHLRELAAEPLRLADASGPIDALLPPPPPPGFDPGPVTGTAGGATGPARLKIGNAAFDRASESLGVPKTRVRNTDDFSHEFQGGTGTPNVAASVPINGAAWAGIAFLAGIIALGIGYYESGRKKRRGHRQHQAYRYRYRTRRRRTSE